jgi:hypothetical protein
MREPYKRVPTRIERVIKDAVGATLLFRHEFARHDISTRERDVLLAAAALAFTQLEAAQDGSS